MNFDKEVLFLGITDGGKTEDGSLLYKVSFFSDGEAEPFKLWLVRGDRNAALIDLLLGLSFGARLLGSFRFTQKDKLYKLGLSEVTVC